MSNNFEMVAVDSSMLSSIGFDAENETLRAVYTKGGIYDYLHVPEKTFKGLKRAKSVGRYFHRNVINGDYAFKRVV